MKDGETVRIEAEGRRLIAVHNRGDLAVITIEWGPIVNGTIRRHSVGAGLSAEQARIIGKALLAIADSLDSEAM